MSVANMKRRIVSSIIEKLDKADNDKVELGAGYFLTGFGLAVFLLTTLVPLRETLPKAMVLIDGMTIVTVVVGVAVIIKKKSK